jgi:uncharacterized protein (TIGR02300 family)
MQIGSGFRFTQVFGGQRVAKSEWGTKRTCPNCGARFYDLRRNPAECPKCGNRFDGDLPSRPRRGAAVVEAIRKPVPEPLVESKIEVVDELEVGLEDLKEGEEDQELEKEDDDELIEDASDLGEDTDDMAEVMEHIDEEVEDKA